MIDKGDKIMGMQLFINEMIEALHCLSESLSELYQESDEEGEED